MPEMIEPIHYYGPAKEWINRLRELKREVQHATKANQFKKSTTKKNPPFDVEVLQRERFQFSKGNALSGEQYPQSIFEYKIRFKDGTKIEYVIGKN